jgi:hypothetical protein
VSADEVSELSPQALRIKSDAAVIAKMRLLNGCVIFMWIFLQICLEKEEWVTDSDVNRLPPRTALPSRTGISHTKIRRPDSSVRVSPTEPPLRDSAGISPDFADACATSLLRCVAHSSRCEQRNKKMMSMRPNR